ncbi:TolC family protein [Deltaproteobacteria bacterium TL4]
MKLKRLKPLMLLLLLGCYWTLLPFNVWGNEVPNEKTETPALLDPEIAAIIQAVEIVQVEGEPYAKVSLRDILRIALLRSIDLKALKTSEKIALSSLLKAQNRNFPIWINGVGLMRQNTPVPGSGFVSLSATDSVGVSSRYQQKLSNGMAYSVTFQESRYQAQGLLIEKEGKAPTGSGSSDWLEKTSLNASISVPFGKDRGTEINDLPVRMAELGVQQSQLETEQHELGILEEIANTYWDWVGIVDAVKVQEKAVILSTQLLSDNRARQQTGAVSQTEISISETQLVREQQALLVHQSNTKRVEDLVKVSLDLDQLEVGLLPSDSPQIKNYPDDKNKLLKQIYENDATLKLLKSALTAKSYEVTQIENDRKDDVDLVFGYTLDGYSETPIAGAQSFAQTDLHGMNVNLTWTIPFSDKITSEQLNQNTIEQQQLQLQIQSQKSRLKIQMDSLIRLLKLTKKEIQTAQLTVKFAMEQLTNEIDRMKLGQSTSFQISQFQQQSLAAIQQETLSRIKFEKYFLDLLVLSKSFYEYYQLGHAQQ